MEKKYIITHEELRTAEPAHLHGLQVVFMPYKDTMLLLWWIIFFATGVIVISQFIRRLLSVHHPKGKK